VTISLRAADAVRRFPAVSPAPRRSEYSSPLSSRPRQQPSCHAPILTSAAQVRSRSFRIGPANQKSDQASGVGMMPQGSLRNTSRESAAQLCNGRASHRRRSALHRPSSFSRNRPGRPGAQGRSRGASSPARNLDAPDSAKNRVSARSPSLTDDVKWRDAARDGHRGHGRARHGFRPAKMGTPARTSIIIPPVRWMRREVARVLPSRWRRKTRFRTRNYPWIAGRMPRAGAQDGLPMCTSSQIFCTPFVTLWRGPDGLHRPDDNSNDGG